MSGGDWDVNPACAGMIHRVTNGVTIDGGKPRVCGDDPARYPRGAPGAV